MTMSSISKAANDIELRARVEAAAYKEAVYSQELADTEFGKSLLRGVGNVTALMWRVAVDTEAAYEGALQAGRGAPGQDGDVITDAQITSAIVAGWPPDAVVGPPQAPAQAPAPTAPIIEPLVEPPAEPPPEEPPEEPPERARRIEERDHAARCPPG